MLTRNRNKTKTSQTHFAGFHTESCIFYAQNGRKGRNGMCGWRYFKVTRKYPDGTKVTSPFYAESGLEAKSLAELLYPNAKVTFIEEEYFD